MDLGTLKQWSDHIPAHFSAASFLLRADDGSGDQISISWPDFMPSLYIAEEVSNGLSPGIAAVVATWIRGGMIRMACRIGGRTFNLVGGATRRQYSLIQILALRPHA